MCPHGRSRSCVSLGRSLRGSLPGPRVDLARKHGARPCGLGNSPAQGRQSSDGPRDRGRCPVHAERYAVRLARFASRSRCHAWDTSPVVVADRRKRVCLSTVQRVEASPPCFQASTSPSAPWPHDHVLAVESVEACPMQIAHGSRGLMLRQLDTLTPYSLSPLASAPARGGRVRYFAHDSRGTPRKAGVAQPLPESERGSPCVPYRPRNDRAERR